MGSSLDAPNLRGLGKPIQVDLPTRSTSHERGAASSSFSSFSTAPDRTRSVIALMSSSSFHGPRNPEMTPDCTKTLLVVQSAPPSALLTGCP